jgi:hypothetical protein
LDPDPNLDQGPKSEWIPVPLGQKVAVPAVPVPQHCTYLPNNLTNHLPIYSSFIFLATNNMRYFSVLDHLDLDKGKEKRMCSAL